MKLQETDIHVFQKHGQLFTTSIDVAEKFGKDHSFVLRAIRNMDCSEEFNRCNFALVSYLDEKGERRPMYHISRDGFTFLAMGFRGKKAAEWKEKFIRAFSLMERTLLNQQNLSWQAQRQQGKVGRREETDTIKDFVEYAKDQGSSKAEFYYSNLTKATYRALFIVKDRFPGSFRDMLNNMQLSYLSAAEFVASNALKDGMAQGLFYKDIYTLAKAKLEQYAAAVGATPVIATRQQLALPQLAA